MNPYFINGTYLDIDLTAFAIVSGAISGTTPKVSSWQKVAGADTVALVGSTTSTVEGTWKVELSMDGITGVDQSTLPEPYVLAPATTGGAGSGTFVMPMRGHKYVRITFTPTSGAGNANVNMGAIIGVPLSSQQMNLGSLQLYSPAAATLAGTWAFAGSNSGKESPPFPSPVWYPFSDYTAELAPAVPAMTTGGQNHKVSLYPFDWKLHRVTFTPTAGAGAMSIFVAGKGA